MKYIFKIVVASLVCAVCTFGATALTFTDVDSDHWAYEQITSFSSKGIVNGDGNGLFRPDDGVTREEFSKMLCETFGYLSGDYNNTYSDVPQNRWSYKYVESCIDYLPGENKIFRPSDPALRDDLATAVVKMMGYTENSAFDKEKVKNAFTDGNNVKTELAPFVSTAVEKGIVNGYPDGTFKPEKGITRAEAVVLLSRAMEKYESQPVSLEEAVRIIDDLSEPSENDKKTAYNIDGYPVTYAECEFQIYNYVNSVVNDYGVLLFESDELLDIMSQSVNGACNMYGAVYKLANENNLAVTMKDIKNTVIASLNEMRTYYGYQLEQLLEENMNCSLNFMLKASYMGIYMTKLSELRYAYGTDEYKNILDKTVDVYEAADGIQAKHILIMFDNENPSDEDKKNAYSVASEVLSKAKAGEDFDSLVAKYNQDPGVLSNPDGYLFVKGMMVKPFEDAAYSLKEGQISGIVETEYGYHIIKRVPLLSGNAVNDSVFQKFASEDFLEWISKEALNIPYTVVKKPVADADDVQKETVDGNEPEITEDTEKYEIDLREYIKENFDI